MPTLSATLLPPAQAPALERAFAICAGKALGNLSDLAASGRTFAFDKAGDYAAWDESFGEIGNWTTGFFTGMALLAWQRFRDERYLRALDGMEPHYRRKVGEGAAETMHDLGFLFSPYSVGLSQLTGDAAQRDLALQAARLLADRFIPAGNYIRAWGRMDELGTAYDGLAIIDCMMNLPLLYWAAAESGDAGFRTIAIRHSDTTLRHFIRADGSVYHSFRFHPDGSPFRADNFCGRDIESSWARGATWAMYGFALGYKHTGDARYLEASRRVTTRWISELDEEIIPVWDFRLPSGEPALRDSSAAAIAACAILELNDLGQADARMLSTKDALIARLLTPDYFDESPATRGVLRHGEVGDGVGKARSAYTSWGDYFLMEALARELGFKVTWW